MLTLFVQVLRRIWMVIGPGCTHENLGTRCQRGRLWVKCNDCGWESCGISYEIKDLTGTLS